MKSSPNILALVLASLAVVSNRAAFAIALGGFGLNRAALAAYLMSTPLEVVPPMILAKTLAVSAAVLTDMPLTLDIDALASFLAGKTLAVYAGTQE